MQNDLREVTLKVPFPGNPKSESETWITLLEQWLSCNFKDYTVTVTQDCYQRNTDIKMNDLISGWFISWLGLTSDRTTFPTTKQSLMLNGRMR